MGRSANKEFSKAFKDFYSQMILWQTEVRIKSWTIRVYNENMILSSNRKLQTQGSFVEKRNHHLAEYLYFLVYRMNHTNKYLGQ